MIAGALIYRSKVEVEGNQEQKVRESLLLRIFGDVIKHLYDDLPRRVCMLLQIAYLRPLSPFFVV